MKSIHKNFALTRCGLFINKEHLFLHATPDFLTQCDCCGLGCGEVKNPLIIGVIGVTQSVVGCFASPPVES